MVWLDVIDHHSELGFDQAIWYVAAPIATVLAGIWVVRDRFHALGRRGAVLPLAAVLILTVAAVSAPLWGLALILALTVPVGLGIGRAA